MDTACVAAKKASRELKHIRIGALPVSSARILRVLFESEEKLTVDAIIGAIEDRFDKRCAVEKIKLLCADPEMLNFLTKHMESSSVTYGINKAGCKLVKCALDSYAEDPEKYANYSKFERKSQSPNVQKIAPVPVMSPALLQARTIEAATDCV